MSPLDKAKREAKRFLEKVDDLERAKKEGESHPCGPCMFRAATKRSSMDLTRALADLRKDGAL